MDQLQLDPFPGLSPLSARKWETESEKPRGVPAIFLALYSLLEEKCVLYQQKRKIKEKKKSVQN